MAWSLVNAAATGTPERELSSVFLGGDDLLPTWQRQMRPNHLELAYWMIGSTRFSPSIFQSLADDVDESSKAKLIAKG